MRLPADRRRFLRGLAAALASAAAAGCDRGGGRPSFRGLDVTGADYGRDFRLTDMHGTVRSLADYRGRVVMLYFGFVLCPDVCPTALARAQAVMTELGPDAARVQLLFVTVDPERDTPELLRAYMASFDPRFNALRGDAAQTRATADEFKVFYKKVPTSSSYTMDHTASTFLFDPRGRLRVVLRHGQTAPEYTADIRTLLAGA